MVVAHGLTFEARGELSAEDRAANHTEARRLACELRNHRDRHVHRVRAEYVERISTLVGYWARDTDGRPAISWPKDVAELAGEPKRYVGPELRS